MSYSLTLKTRRATDVADCEDICLRETQFVCRTFAFKIGRDSNYNNNNCELSDRDFRDMSQRDFDQDGELDFVDDG